MKPFAGTQDIKAKVALADLAGEKTLAELAQLYVEAPSIMSLKRQKRQLANDTQNWSTHLQHPLMGAHILRDQLNSYVIAVARTHVGSIIKRMGIEAIYKKPSTSKKHPGHKYCQAGLGSGYHLYPNCRWTHPMARGFVYLTAGDGPSQPESIGHKSCNHFGDVSGNECFSTGIQSVWDPEYCQYWPGESIQG